MSQSFHFPNPFALTTLDNCRHAIAVLELEKKAYKLRAQALALKVAHLEKTCRELRKGVGNE